jgi:hypothetical protein
LIFTVILVTLTFTPLAKGEMVYNDSVHIEFLQFNPCANGGTGENVQVSGDLHEVYSVTENDNRYVFNYVTNANYKGIGLTTGDKYQSPGGVHIHESYQLPPGQQYEGTFFFHVRMGGQGPGNNLLIHQMGHITINANGEVSTEFETVRAECK